MCRRAGTALPGSRRRGGGRARRHAPDRLHHRHHRAGRQDGKGRRGGQPLRGRRLQAGLQGPAGGGANVGRIFDQARRDARGFEPYAQPDRRAVPAQIAGAGGADRRPVPYRQGGRQRVARRSSPICARSRGSSASTRRISPASARAISAPIGRSLQRARRHPRHGQCRDQGRLSQAGARYPSRQADGQGHAAGVRRHRHRRAWPTSTPPTTASAKSGISPENHGRLASHRRAARAPG